MPLSKLQGQNKELLIIPDAVHTDLYDRMDVIPFEKMDNSLLKIFKKKGKKIKSDSVSNELKLPGNYPYR